MNFLWGRKSDSSRATRVRKDELDQLRRTQRDLHWLTEDTFEKTITTQQVSIRLSIHVPSAFPSNPPVIRLLTPATHPWVDTQGYFTLSPIVTQWRSDSPSLVTMLHTLSTKLTETPPTPSYSQYNPQPGGYQGYQPPNNAPGGGGTQPSPGYAPYNPYATPGSGGNNPTSTTAPGNSLYPNMPGGQQNPNQYTPYGQPGGGAGGAAATPSHNNGNRPEIPPRSRSGSTTAGNASPSTTSPVPLPQTNQLKTSTYTRPSTPPLPPMPSVDTTVIPPEPPFDRHRLNQLTVEELTELDDSQEKVRSHVVTHCHTLQQLYEQQINLENDIKMLKDQFQGMKEQHDTEIMPQYDELNTQIDDKERQLKELRQEYQGLSSKFSIYTVIDQIHTIMDQIEVECDDLTMKFTSSYGRRNNHSNTNGNGDDDDDKLDDFLASYQKLRQRWHYHDIIVRQLKLTYQQQQSR